MTAHRNPLYVVGQAPRDTAPHRLLAPAQTPGIDRLQAILARAAAAVAADRQRRLAARPARRFNNFAADTLLSSAGETPTAPAPPRQSTSPAGAALGRQGAGAGRHLHAADAEVIRIEDLRAARAVRLARERRPPAGRPTGGHAA